MSAHAWMPVSPCGDGCLPTTLPSASVARRSLRWVAVLAAVLASPALVLVRVLPRRRKAAVVRIGARTLLRALGIRLVSTGSRSEEHTSELQSHC